MSKEEGVWAKWVELQLPQMLSNRQVQEIHATIQTDWDVLRKTACQTAAGRALWSHVTHDPLAELLAGEAQLRTFHDKIQKDIANNAREISGVILAVRTLWFDSKLDEALRSMTGDTQVVLLGAGMDTRAYRLSCLKEAAVFEVDFAEVLQVKSDLLEVAMADEQLRPQLKAKSVKYVATDIREKEWLKKLQMAGFEPERSTVWVLEGILYYLTDAESMQVLSLIAENCARIPTILLADFLNKQSTSMCKSLYRFYCDWPDHLLPSLGFSDVKLSQLGDPDAHFGLMDDPTNLFNKLRNLPRTEDTCPLDGTPCCRLYLVQASASPFRPPP